MAAQLLSTGLVIETRAKIILPASIGRIMLSILSLMENEKLEYGIFLKGNWNNEALTVTVEDGSFFLPAQSVTGAHIEFTEQPPGPEWNVVIHRHPPGVTRFSGTDKNSINQEFLASLIFMPPWSFPDSIVNIPIAAGVKLQVEGTVKVQGPMFPEGEGLEGPVKAKIRAAYQPAAGNGAGGGDRKGIFPPLEGTASPTGASGQEFGVTVPVGSRGATVMAVGPAAESSRKGQQPRRGLRRLDGSGLAQRPRVAAVPASDWPAEREILGLGAYASRSGIHPEDVEDIEEFIRGETETGGVRVVNGGPTGHHQVDKAYDWIPRDPFHTR